MTIVLSGNEIVAAARGDVTGPDVATAQVTGTKEVRAGLLAGPGQVIHVVDIDDDGLAELRDPAEFADRLARHLTAQKLI